MLANGRWDLIRRLKVKKHLSSRVLAYSTSSVSASVLLVLLLLIDFYHDPFNRFKEAFLEADAPLMPHSIHLTSGLVRNPCTFSSYLYWQYLPRTEMPRTNLKQANQIYREKRFRMLGV